MRTRRVLLVAATTGYQTHAFEDAARRLGVELQYATDRCHMLGDPWRDAAVPIRLNNVASAVDAIEQAVTGAAAVGVDGVLAVGDRPAVIAAFAAGRLGLPFHSSEGALAASDKFLARESLRHANVATPAFRRIPRSSDPAAIFNVDFPCVLKPLGLSGSRGVIRADDQSTFVAAFARVRALLESLPHDPREEERLARQREWILIETFIPGREIAVEGVMTEGRLRVLAVFDKPEPLDGPFFEETIYVTPPALDAREVDLVVTAVAAASNAMGLSHGPIHAECRINARGVFIVEIAARPIGGLCARTLRFSSAHADGLEGLESVLLRHAVGEPVEAWTREAGASGVMMIPVPRAGVLRHVGGIESAAAVPCVTELHITAKPDQVLVPLPEGASYLGFIFARSDRPDRVVSALQGAHRLLKYSIAPQMRMIESHHG